MHDTNYGKRYILHNFQILVQTEKLTTSGLFCNLPLILVFSKNVRLGDAIELEQTNQTMWVL